MVNLATFGKFTKIVINKAEMDFVFNHTVHVYSLYETFYVSKFYGNSLSLSSAMQGRQIICTQSVSKSLSTDSVATKMITASK